MAHRRRYEEIVNYLTCAGPWGHADQILRVFCGSPLDRLDVIRQAVINGEIGGLPITTGPFDGAAPPPDEHIRLWAPMVLGAGALSGGPLGLPKPAIRLAGGPLQRYPPWRSVC